MVLVPGRGVDVSRTSPSSVSCVLCRPRSLSSSHIVNWFDISFLRPKENLSLDEQSNKSGGMRRMCVREHV